MTDLNARAQNGQNVADGKANAKPLNGAAAKIDEDTPRLLTVRELLSDSFERAKNTERPHACKTGIGPIDDITGGLRQGHVWVFGAETNWGKSTFLVMIADENLKRGKRVLIVSAEDSESIYGDRLMARRARVRARALRDGCLSEKEWLSVADVTAAAENMPAFLDARGRKVEKIVKQVDRVIKEHQIDVVLYDYLQEFISAKKHENERVAFKEIARLLRTVVKDNNRTGIIFSQITEQQGKKYPDKNSIRESRDVSNAAEAVLLGFTPKENIMDEAGGVSLAKGTRCVLLDKVKDGRKGFTIPLEWDERSACFNEITSKKGPYDDFDDIADEYVDARYP